MLSNGQYRGDQRSRNSATRKSLHSYSSSEDSYGRLQSHSRSASGTSQTHYDDLTITPPPKLLMDEFNQHSPTFGEEYGEDTFMTNGSKLIHDDDPVAMHLLLETALGDSDGFEILTPDELHSLQKEEALYHRRIEAGKRKLFLETKVHNAAVSLQRLEQRSNRGEGGDPSKKKRSLLGFRTSTNANVLEITEQNAESKQLEELALEVWRLEKKHERLRNIRLQHTAAVLQLDHKTRLQNTRSSRHSLINGTHSNRASRSLSLLLDGSLHNTEGQNALRSKLKNLNGLVYEVMRSTDDQSEARYPPPPDQNQDQDSDLAYLESGLLNIQRLQADLTTLVQDCQARNKAAEQRALSAEQTARQTSDMLGGLWEILKAGEEDVRHHKNSSRRLSDDSIDRIISDDDSDEEELDDPSFSLQTFSTKVQRLCNKASTLAMQQSTLSERIRQEREVSSKAEAAKASERSQFAEQLQEAHDQHLVSERNLQNAQSQLMEAKTQLDQALQEIAFSKQQHEHENSSQLASERSARQQAEEGFMMQKEAHIAQISQLQHDLSEKTEEIENNNAEREDLEAEIVRLQTELTVARAELDGAYGTRAQRAAEVAANPEVRKEFDELNAKNAEMEKAREESESRIEMLQKELREMVGEYENMVKSGVEAEKEREALECTVDALRERAEQLEAKLGEERIKTIGRTNTGSGNETSTEASDDTPKRSTDRGRGESTSMSVMRNEFKKMMREARADHFRSLRAEQEERRKLEAQIRQLRKEPGSNPASTLSPGSVGKSGLSRSITAS